ncbi:hypothetical protein L6248_02330, partial [Candidatus Parcubacteria bacterium]|nr:hypothetical protein [Candidatus Parcubacteria bacterium]
EMQEGSNWEAVQFAVKHELSNLTVVIDNNRLQAMDFLEKILTIEGRKEDLQKKMKAFGFEVRTCDGHNPDNIASVIEKWIKKQKNMNLCPETKHRRFRIMKCCILFPINTAKMSWSRF